MISNDALARLRAHEPDLAGTKYALLRTLGRGGMGVVYAVYDRELQREVAMKVLDFGPAEKEAQVLARLEHPGLVPVHEVGTLPDGRAYYTMKLVQGAQLQPEGSLAQRMRILIHICDAIAFAHSKGVLHRDLKPQNVMVGPFGEVLILDWGLAKFLDGAQETHLAGTPGFMAPEQEQGGPVDARADIHSLGKLLHWMLPQDSPPALQAIASKASHPDQQQRYSRVQELQQEIARFLDGEPVQAYREPLPQRAMRVAKKHKAAIGIVFAYLAGRALILFFTHH